MARLTQKDLAKRLGLSQATVSAVLNNSTSIKIAEATRARILEEAKKGAYWPNQLANALLARKTRTIGVAYLSGYSQVIIRKLAELVNAIEEAGYLPIVFDVSSNVGGDRICQFFRDFNVGAVVMLNPSGGSFAEKSYPKYLAGIVPTITVDAVTKLGEAQFQSDRRQGFGLMAEHLVNLGYRKFGILGSYLPDTIADPTFYHTYGFKTGVCEKLREAGLEPPVMEFYNPSQETQKNPHLGGEVAMESLLASGKRPEVVLCSNDAFAIGALAVCARWGIRVPEDMAITGFQNEIQAQYAQPPLTTVEIPAEKLARQAVEYLVERLDKDGPWVPEKERFILPCSLVVRQSCGAQLRKKVSGSPVQPARRSKHSSKTPYLTT